MVGFVAIVENSTDVFHFSSDILLARFVVFVVFHPGIQEALRGAAVAHRRAERESAGRRTALDEQLEHVGRQGQATLLNTPTSVTSRRVASSQHAIRAASINQFGAVIFVCLNVNHWKESTL